MEPVLTDKEAKFLLDMIKKAYVDHVEFPGKRKKVEFEAEGDSSKDIFVINIFRGNINLKKYSYGIRVKRNGAFLFGLDIGDTLKHQNPDGKEIVGSHWHVYQENYGRRYAVPADDIDSEEFVENTYRFFKEINQIPAPDVSYQMEIV